MNMRFQTVQVTVTCANMSGLLFELSMRGIPLHHLYRTDELTASFCVQQPMYRKARSIIEDFGGRINNQIPATSNYLLKCLLQRPILILGVVLILILTLYLPTKVLFITVYGNEQLSQQMILSAASDCGLKFGVSRHKIRSEKIKNELLSALPELNWVGINTKGCLAEISVRERTLPKEEISEPIISSMVASRDGVISGITVTSGNLLCRIGQAVKKGQLLVSGYADCGRCIYGTKANAEVYAQTRHSLHLSLLTNGVTRGSVTDVTRKYGLIIGKKRINFYKGSGIYDTTCVRMYVEYQLTLPGGFHLPITWTIQEERHYNTSSLENDPQNAEEVLMEYANRYLINQMIAGKVIQEHCQITSADGVIHLIGRYDCNEMIGQIRSEEIIEHYEQTG